MVPIRTDPNLLVHTSFIVCVCVCVCVCVHVSVDCKLWNGSSFLGKYDAGTTQLWYSRWAHAGLTWLYVKCVHLWHPLFTVDSHCGYLTCKSYVKRICSQGVLGHSGTSKQPTCGFACNRRIVWKCIKVCSTFCRYDKRYHNLARSM